VPDRVERTFCFVDLSGFAALTEAHGDLDAVDLLDRFFNLVRQSLGSEDELVKSIGDAVMVASASPEGAVSVLAGLWARLSEEAWFPLPRAGANHGPAVGRDGDYIGGAVNLAARVADHAGGGQALATAAVAAAASARGFKVVELGAQRLRNLTEKVELFQIILGANEGDEVIDPVCRMRVEPEFAAGSLHHECRRFWFCSMSCVAAFAADPGRYRPPAETKRA
jgi:class 3 adenylate cyclase/YHS domain-containing protein